MVKKLIRFLDLKVSDPDEVANLRIAFEDHLASGKFLISDVYESFEAEFATSQGRAYCLGVNTGTDALTIGLRLLKLKAGGLVVTSPFSWIASSSCLYLAGLEPLYVDIGDNLQINLDLVDQALSASSGEIAAVLIPHLHGNVSSLSRLAELRKRHGVKIIEDCAQAFAARDLHGNLAGTTGDIAAFSFNPMKILGALGDAGAVLFDDESLIERARSLRHSGVIGAEGLAVDLATNCRIDALQASLLRVRLKFFEQKLQRRRQICALYNDSISHLLTPITECISHSNHYCYQVLCEQRDHLAAYLATQGIEARIRHEFLIPDHPAFHAARGHYPNARRLVSRTLCLPMHHQLTNEDVQYVINAVRRFYDFGG